MKCPKCSYLGLDNGDRCKNCGYEFSLIDAPRGAAPARPRATPLNLPPTPRADAGRLRPTRPTREQRAAIDGALGRPLERTADSAPLDLPLFDVGFQQGVPLPPPHRPLAVRRSGAATPSRHRVVPARPNVGTLPLELEGPPESTGRTETPVSTPAAPAPPLTRAPGEVAQGWRRSGAWMVDLSLIVLVDLLTVYFTLRVCGLEPAEWDILPPVPLAGFFLVLNCGYVILLTASLGQTLGKMALRLEVVADDRATIGVARATARTLAALVSLLPAGLGLIWALFGDGRALHDRMTRTRVVHVPLS